MLYRAYIASPYRFPEIAAEYPEAHGSTALTLLFLTAETGNLGITLQFSFPHSLFSKC
jgi:hypothetical protein